MDRYSHARRSAVTDTVEAIKVLIVDDSPADTELMSRALRSAGLSITVKRVESQETLRIALETHEWDIVLIDYNLPGFSAIGAITLIRRYSGAVPLLIVSGSIGEEMTAELMRSGAVDVIRKENSTSRLAIVVKRELEVARVRHNALEAQGRFSDYAEATSEFLWEMDADLRFIFVSELFQQLTGLPTTELTEKQRIDVFPPDDKIDPNIWLHHIDDLNCRRPFRNFRSSLARADGSIFHVRVSGNPHFDSYGRFLGYRGVGTDITAEVEADLAIKKLSTLLSESIEALAEGFALFDSEERLVLSNSRYKEFHSWNSDLLSPGTQYGVLIRNSVKHAVDVLTGVTTAEDWIAAREARFGAPSGSYESRQSGRWLRYSYARTISGATISLCADISDLKETEQRLRDAIESIRDGFALWDAEDRLVSCNARFRKTYGKLVGGKACSLIGRSFVELFEPLRNAGSLRSSNGGDDWFAPRGKNFLPPAEPHLLQANGNLWIEVREARTGDDGIVSTYTDVTARKAAEESLRNLQKMEALGTLAGGIAHDLNNMLVPVLGLTQLAQERIPKDDPAYEYLGDVIASANHGKNLVKQILAFSRSEATDLKPIDLGNCVSDGVRLVRAATSPMIEIVVDIKDGVIWIMGSETQFHQILTNLCTNAAQAIGSASGKIQISLQTRQVTGRDGDPALLAPGEYAYLAVIDDGPGVDEATRLRAFEPFFTTKEVGSGTGLGLSVVHGIVTAHHGFLDLRSRLGSGTQFDLYFPLVTGFEHATSD